MKLFRRSVAVSAAETAKSTRGAIQGGAKSTSVHFVRPRVRPRVANHTEKELNRLGGSEATRYPHLESSFLHIVEGEPEQVPYWRLVAGLSIKLSPRRTRGGDAYWGVARAVDAAPLRNSTTLFPCVQCSLATTYSPLSIYLVSSEHCLDVWFAQRENRGTFYQVCVCVCCGFSFRHTAVRVLSLPTSKRRGAAPRYNKRLDLLHRKKQVKLCNSLCRLFFLFARRVLTMRAFSSGMAVSCRLD